MPSLNKVILIGRCGRDPEVRRATLGDAIANISIATSKRFKDKVTGETREETEWHRIVMFGSLAEITEQYVRKGRLLYIEGSLRTRKWTDQTEQERYTTEIIANTMKLLDRKDALPAQSTPDDYAKASGRGNVSAQSARSASLEELADDIPFLT